MLLGRLFNRQIARLYLGDDQRLLSELSALVEKLNQTASVNSKVALLKESPGVLPILERIYNPLRKFHVTSGTLRHDHPAGCDGAGTLEELLDRLEGRLLTGNAARTAVALYMNKHPEFASLITAIIDKNLKARIGHAVIKRALLEIGSTEDKEVRGPRLYCSLGMTAEDCVDYVATTMARGDQWLISRKYDGIRALLVYSRGNLKILSRRKVEFSVFNPLLRTELLKNCKRISEDFVIDGELVFLDPLGKEDFAKTVSLVKSKEPKDIEGLVYRAFDYVDPQKSMAERNERLLELFPADDRAFLSAIPQHRLDGPLDLDRLKEEAAAQGIEGFILRRDALPCDGRSRDLLKVKPWLDAEFPIIGYERGPMRFFQDGKEVEETVLLSITVNVCDAAVKVGSGFSVSERRQLAQNPESLIGRLMTVKYQSESRGLKSAAASLRFPVFKALHGPVRTE